MKEIWKSIEGTNDFYQVSNLGRVRSWKSGGKIVTKRAKTPRILRPYMSKCGYRKCVIFINNKRNKHKISRLVGKAFLSNPQEKPQINHINGVKTDDFLKNLEWCTRSENQIHAYKNKLQLPRQGELCGTSKLKEVDVLRIINSYESGEYTQYQLAKMNNINQSTVNRIVNNKRWKHLTKEAV